tara:strand:+ start:502 stop:1482 length:981 start_codon:yes stop_codon:yes gene_type:complete
MPVHTSHISSEFHAIMVDEITKVCERSLRRWGPHQLCIGSPHTGYVHPLMLLGILARSITDRSPEYIQQCVGYCGPCWQWRRIGEPFNDNINAFPDRIRSMMNSWVENVSSIAYDLYQRDIQDYVPWCEIKKILHFYQSEARLQIRRYQNEDPENLKEFQDRYQRDLYECPHMSRALGHSLEDWAHAGPVQPPVIKERCEWQIQKLNDLFRDLCVPEIDERYPEGLLSVSHTREDIAQWWAITIQQECRLSWVSWMRGPPHLETDSSEPPDTSPIERPIVNEPLHPAKKNLTELLYFIDEKRESWEMNEGEYLKISDMMKKIFESI